MRDFIYSLMTDRRKGLIFIPLKSILYILSLAYGLGIFVRTLLYKFRIFKIHKVPIRIISVGNLTLGGTGKTPFVMRLARILEHELKRNVAVLIRGYGWDEQTMLKKNLPDIPILVGQDRAQSSHKAIKLYGSDTAVLDDGFQHWELERDLNIVLIDSGNPFGNGHLFPRGILRESVKALKRADIVVLTKVNKKKVDVDLLKKVVKDINDKAIFLEVVHQPNHLYDVKARELLGVPFIKNKNVVLVSSIGDPVYFEQTVKDLGATVVDHFVFSDHYNYTKRDIDRIMAKCAGRKFDLMLTTEKDIVKLNRLSLSFEGYTLMTLGIDMEIAEGREILIARLHSLYNS